MRRRVVFSIAGFLALIVVGLGALWYATQPMHRINESAVKQIQNGMTLAEVEAIFGVPPGDYATAPTHVEHWSLQIDEKRCKAWSGNEISVRVHFNDDLQVTTFGIVRFREQSWWTKVREWIMHE